MCITVPWELACDVTPATKQDSLSIPLESSAEEPSAVPRAESGIKCPTEFHKNYVKET